MSDYAVVAIEHGETSHARVQRWPTLLSLAGYALLVLAAAWPLTLNFRTALPADPSGDTGIYVWNQWVFRHELLDHGRNPLYTSHVLVPGPPVDLALHNYTLFQDALSLVLSPVLGPVGAFNATWLLLQALSGFGVFLLARRVTTSVRIAWLAGAVFACSPILIARSSGHQSLVAAAPLAFFLHYALQAADRGTLRPAVLAGVMAAWAATCDAYYGIYCVMMLAVVAAARGISWTRVSAPPGRDRLGAIVSALMVVPASVVVVLVLTGGGTMRIFGLTISARSLYTPMLVLTVLALVRLALAARRHGRWRVEPIGRFRFVQVVAGGAVCAALLLPLLDAARARIAAGGSLQLPILWRSSAAGVDLLSFVVPNPVHPLVPEWARTFAGDGPGFIEGVASVPIVVLAIVLLAVWKRGAPPREWTALAVGFAVLALGPFVVVGHANTAVPAPWAVLRYVPIVGAARMPTRFAIPMMLAVAVAFAWALERLDLRRGALALALSLLAFELWPVPREVAAARVPRPYVTIAADPRDVAVLDLPFGIRDGTGGIGRFSTAVFFYQTRHAKRVIAGYLSRVPPAAYERAREDPVLRALARLSAGEPVDERDWRQALDSWPALVKRASLGYVAVEDDMTPPELDRFVAELRLRPLDRADGFSLYAVP